jgi:hypothetical protein
VIGRPPDYDTASDNIVRVHASMLRKRLDQFFSSEGRDEPIIIELPKGNYAPVFSERSLAEVVIPLLQPLAPPVELPQAPPTAPKMWLFAGLAALFAVVILVLLIRPASTPQLFRAKPAIHEFWSPIFVPGSKTDIVLDDEGVGLYEELTGTRVALSDYFNRNYLRDLAANSSKQKLSGDFAGSIVLKRQSSYASATLLWKLSGIAAGVNGQAGVHFARDYSFRAEGEQCHSAGQRSLESLDRGF